MIKYKELVKGKKLLIGMPCYGGNVNYLTVQGMLELTYLAMLNQINIHFCFIGNESLIPRGRNHVVAEFLATGFDHLLFLDADIGFDAIDVLKLLSKNEDVVVGACPIKRNPLAPDYVVNFVGGQANSHGNGLFEVKNAGTGFMMIKRCVFDKMKIAYPELHYETDYDRGAVTVNDAERLKKLKESLYSFFDTMHDKEDKNDYLSEDYTFCLRWKKIGGKILLDPSIKLDHVGGYVFRGDVSRIFKSE